MATAPDLVVLPNGEVLARGVYNAYLALQIAGARAGFNVWVSSGYRTHAKQVQIFTSRFRQQDTGGGPFNDVRYWNGAAYGYPGGTRWVRFSSAGTVAVPGTSMHEKASAVDFGGIPAGGATAYARWLRVWGPTYGFSPTGYGFNEAWHYDYTGDPWAGGSGGGSNPFPGGDMPLDANDKAWLTGMFAQEINLIRVPNTNYSWGQAAVSELQGPVKDKLDGLVARTDATNTTLSQSITPLLREILAAVKAGGMTEEQIVALGTVISAQVIAALPPSAGGDAPTPEEYADAVAQRFLAGLAPRAV